MSTAIVSGPHTLTLHGDPGTFKAKLTQRELEPHLHEVTLSLTAPVAAVPPALRLGWTFPIVDVYGMFVPSFGRDRGLVVNWQPFRRSSATVNMPVVALHSQAGRNRLTFACSDALNPIDMRAGVSEETALFECDIKFFPEPSAAVAQYEARVLLDTRGVPYYEALGGVSNWWAAQPGYEPAPVPETARLPMYSSWYSFHQTLVVEEVVRQCKLARSLGCEAVIVDDGWQTLDARRGYAFTGDWEPERIPDMRGFVEKVHAAGMKFLLWYGVPQVGAQARHFGRFKEKFLQFHPEAQCGILDPRYPDVREYLITLYERHLREWKLDGFKLDFVDNFQASPRDVKSTAPGRDYESIPVAADRLLSDVIARLRAIKSDIMIEFRQQYVGPLMRKYGNMFRATDCPNDATTNRVRTIDVRLLAGTTATHSDMLMWHPDEPVESAALQLLNVLFSVPQISVLIDKLPLPHQAMLKFYLQYWRDNRDVLLDGALRPCHPESLYPVVIAETATKRIVAAYDDAVIPAGAPVPELHLVNATRGVRVVLENSEPISGKLLIRDCTGKQTSRRSLSWAAGVHALQIPPAGVAVITSA